MGHHSYIPKAPLSDYVNSIWIWEDYQPLHSRERILPAGIMELLINLNEKPIRTYYSYDGFCPHNFDGLLVAGARSEYFITDTSYPTSVIGVWFYPGAAMRFFSVAGQELQNRHIPLELLWHPAEAQGLYHRLMEAPSHRRRFHILEETLLQRLAQSREEHPAVRYALQALKHSPQRIADVLEDVNLSAPYFIQIFREAVGLSPKLYSRVMRFQSAIQTIAQLPQAKWTEIALNSGYYDQSHFINEFQTFSGILPSEYFPENAEHPSNLGIFT